MKTSILLLASLLVALAMMEVAIRVYAALAFPKMMVLDEKLGWKHVRNKEKTFHNELGERVLIRLNQHGHRGTFYDYERSKNTYRILVLGDSMTEGSEVEEADLFTTRIEAQLPGVEVINAGVGSYGTVQEYLYLLDEGIRYRPDLVLLMFYKNDLIENCLSYSPGIGPRPYAYMGSGRLHIEGRLLADDYVKVTIPTPFRVFLARHSYLFYFLNSRVYHQLFAERVRAIHRMAVVRAEACGLYEVLFELIRGTRQELDTRGIDFFLVLIPTKEEARSGASAAHDRIAAFCRENGIEFGRLLERFHSSFVDGGPDLYFPVDIHWTTAGHGLAADEIARLIAPRVLGRVEARPSAWLPYGQTVSPP